jgi:hypothetical protein
MTHKFSILRDALPSEVRREADRNVARILAELNEQERHTDSATHGRDSGQTAADSCMNLPRKRIAV